MFTENSKESLFVCCYTWVRTFIASSFCFSFLSHGVLPNDMSKSTEPPDIQWTHTRERARTHARTWIYNYYYCCISFARISDELLQKLDYLVHSVATRYLESFEMWCWRMMEKISWTDRVRNGEVLLTVKEQRNILHEIIKRKAHWIGHILRRNCLLQRVTDGKIKGG